MATNEVTTVIISIKPRWWELIKAGKKTVEFRSTKPRVAENLKVYVYATSPTRKVVGEFYCPSIGDGQLTNGDSAANERILNGTCLSEEEAMNYLKLPRKIGIGDAPRQKPCFLWHINELVVYDNPKKLSEFCSPDTKQPLARPPQSWYYAERGRSANEMADTELKPCPFCGAKPIEKSKLLPSNQRKVYIVICDNFACSVAPHTDYFFTKEGARNVWNRRADNG